MWQAASGPGPSSDTDILPNMDLLSVALLTAFLLAGGLAAWLALERVRTHARAAAALADLASAREEVTRLSQRAEAAAAELASHQVELTRLRERLRAGEEVHAERESAFARREADLKRSIAELTEEFRSIFGRLSGDALRKASEQFLALAETRLREQQTAAAAELEKRKTSVDELIRPMSETLRRTEEKLAGLAAASSELRTETGRLVRALSKPEVRGRYGEVQLRRVAELAGMRAYCDFSEQESQRDGEGRLLRPDMIVRLPNERVIAVDAKANLQAYVEAASAATDEEREEHLERFARHVADQVSSLSRKQYWSEFEGSPEFVVMFVPGDQFLDAALARRPDLLERAAEENVILASPGTLIGLLRAVAVGWREKRLEEQARELFDLGRQLHERAAVAFEHIADLGGAIDQAADRYNRMVGSLESRLLPTLRKFEEGGARSPRDLPDLPEVTTTTRQSTLLFERDA